MINTILNLLFPGKLQVIEFMFMSFTLESDSSCSYDSLTIYDGASVNEASSLGPFCGYVEPQYMYTTRNTAILIFQSDGSQTRDGFQISFTAVEATTPTAVVTTQQPGRRPGQTYNIIYNIYNIYIYMDVNSYQHICEQINHNKTLLIFHGI